jgi:hypothetical protein
LHDWGLVSAEAPEATVVPFCGNSTHLRLANGTPSLGKRHRRLSRDGHSGSSVMTKMPAPLAPFATGASVGFLPDPSHVERVIECEWVPLDAPDHWRLTTTWMDHDGQHVRIGDAVEVFLTALLISDVMSGTLGRVRQSETPHLHRNTGITGSTGSGL